MIFMTVYILIWTGSEFSILDMVKQHMKSNWLIMYQFMAWIHLWEEWLLYVSKLFVFPHYLGVGKKANFPALTLLWNYHSLRVLFVNFAFIFRIKKEKSISKYPTLNINNVFLRFPNKILCPSYTYCCLTLCPYCILTLTKLPFFSIKSSCCFTCPSLPSPAKWVLKSIMVEEIWKCLLLVRLLKKRHEEIVWPGVK